MKIETKNNWLQWQCIDVIQFFIAAFVVYFLKTRKKKYCFCSSSRKIWSSKHLDIFPDLPSFECTSLRLRSKPWQHEIWGLYTFTSYNPFENNIFVVVGSSFPKDDHSLSENIHAHIRTSTTLENWWQAAQPELSFQSTFTVWYYFSSIFCATPCWPDLDGSLPLSGECFVLKGRQHEQARV